MSAVNTTQAFSITTSENETHLRCTQIVYKKVTTCVAELVVLRSKAPPDRVRNHSSALQKVRNHVDEICIKMHFLMTQLS